MIIGINIRLKLDLRQNINFNLQELLKRFTLNKRKTMHEPIEENALRINIPNINGEIPAFIVFRVIWISFQTAIFVQQ